MTLNLIQTKTNPITAYANGIIDKGAFVKSVSGDDVVTAAMSSFAWSDIKVEEADDTSTDYKLVIGIAGNDASAAGVPIAVYTEGLFIVRASDAITVGNRVQMAESTDEYEVAALTTTRDNKIGVALTGASATDAYLIILLRIGI